MWGGQVADAVQAALTAELKEMQKIAGGLREHRDEVEGRILDNNACIEQAAAEPSERHVTGVQNKYGAVQELRSIFGYLNSFKIFG